MNEPNHGGDQGQNSAPLHQQPSVTSTAPAGANERGSTQSTPLHPVHAPQGSTVPYEELRGHVSNERTVRGGVRSLLDGVKARLEEIAKDDKKDANTLRQEVRQLSGELDGDSWSKSVVENTGSKGEPDPQANRPAAPQLNR